MQRQVELLLSELDGLVVLRAPEVGRFTCALDRGNLVSPGERAGMIRTLGESVELIVPHGVVGRVTNEKPERVHEPVGYGDVLYRLASIETGVAEEVESTERGSDVLAYRAPHSGRFWHRPAPGDPAFVGPGDALDPGTIVGLLEVMKTFTHLTYRPAGELPEQGRVVRMLVGDGAEVKEGMALVEVEGA